MGNEQFYDWSDDAIAPLRPPKTKQREALAEEVEEFLAAGGVIEKVPYNPIPELVDMATGCLKRRYPKDEGLTAPLPSDS